MKSPDRRSVTVYLGLGSNLGDRLRNLSRALRSLPERGIRVLASSPIYETSPVGPRQGNYLNAVLKARTSLDPSSLLRTLKRIEKECGRAPSRRWGPRTLDLDILVYGNRQVRSRSLSIPHPRYAERRFVLVPWADLSPRLRPPGSRLTVGRMARKLTAPAQRVKLKYRNFPR